MASGKVVEGFPLGQFLVQIDDRRRSRVTLIEFLLIGPMGAFHLAVELWRARLDVDVANALVFDVPVKLGLEFVPAVGSDALHTKRDFFKHILNEGNGVFLIMAGMTFRARMRVASSIAVYG